MNEKEFKKLMEQVKKSGLSREAYVRAVLARSVPRPTPQIDYERYTKELHAIGVNINRIAAHANATGFFCTDEYERNMRELNNVTSGNYWY